MGGWRKRVIWMGCIWEGAGEKGYWEGAVYFTISLLYNFNCLVPLYTLLSKVRRFGQSVLV